MARSHSKVNFLDFPGELRNEIYGYIFDSDSTESEKLRLLLTCRLVHDEAKALAFEKTLFSWPGVRSFNATATFAPDGHLSQDTMKLIKRVRIPVDGLKRLSSIMKYYHLPLEYLELRSTYGAYFRNIWDPWLAKLIKGCPSLKQISIERLLEENHPINWRAQEPRGCFSLHRAFQSRVIKRRAYFDWLDFPMLVHKVGDIQDEGHETCAFTVTLSKKKKKGAELQELTFRWKAPMNRMPREVH